MSTLLLSKYWFQILAERSSDAVRSEDASAENTALIKKTVCPESVSASVLREGVQGMCSESGHTAKPLRVSGERVWRPRAGSVFNGRLQSVHSVSVFLEIHQPVSSESSSESALSQRAQRVCSASALSQRTQRVCSESALSQRDQRVPQ